MENIASFLLKLTTVFLLILPFVLFLAWCGEPAARVFLAKSSLQKAGFGYDSSQSPSEIKETQRKIQQHFRKYRVHVPTEDIIIVADSEQRYVIGDLLRKACGTGNIFIWVPFKFRIPFKKTYIFEKCWVAT